MLSMPLTQREGVAVLASVGVCSLELAEAPKTDQKMGPSGPLSWASLDPNCIQNALLSPMVCLARGMERRRGGSASVF